MGAAASGKSRAAARILRAVGMIFGRVMGRVFVMGRSLVCRVRGDKMVGPIFAFAQRVFGKEEAALLYFAHGKVPFANGDSGGCTGDS